MQSEEVKLREWGYNAASYADAFLYVACEWYLYKNSLVNYSVIQLFNPKAY